MSTPDPATGDVRPGSSRQLHLITDADRRGAQTFAMDLTRQLHGDSSSVVALTGSAHEEPLPVRTLGPKRLHPSTLAALRRELRHADVAVAHGSSTLVACALGGWGVGTPFVYRQISDQSFWVNSALRRARVRAYLSRAAAVVALWSGAARTLVDGFGVPAERVHVIPNGVPSAGFGPASDAERRSARAALGVPPDGGLVLSIGALVPEKGVDLTILAVGRLPAMRLVVVGSGPQEETLRRLAARVAPGRVVFTGPLRDTDLAYAAADVLSLPSRGGDSMPAVLIEAGVRGLPSVSTPVAGIVEIVEHGVTGLLLDGPTDVDLAAGLGHAHERRGPFGAAARRRCLARFSIDVVARQWAELMDQVVVARPLGRRRAPDP